MKWFCRSVGCFQIIYYNISFFYHHKLSNIYVRMLVGLIVYWSIFSVFFCNFFFHFQEFLLFFGVFPLILIQFKTSHAFSTLLFGLLIWPLGYHYWKQEDANNLQLRIEITFTMLWVFLFHIQRNLCTWNPSTNYWFETI